MAYFNNTNNREKQSVTTRSYHTSNGDAVKPTAFDWSYQDDMFKVVFSPELPESERTEARRYDYKNQWITCIKRLKCIDLYKHIKELVLPTIEQKKDMFVSVPVAEVNQFGFGIRFNSEGKCIPYVKLIRNIDPQTLTSEAEIEYEFKKGEVIINYDNSTGKFDDRSLDHAEMALFLNDLECFVKASSNAFNHANRVVDKTYKDQITGLIRAVGNKVGAEMPSYNSAQRAGARYGGVPLFDNNSAQAPMETISSAKDLNLDDGELPF